MVAVTAPFSLPRRLGVFTAAALVVGITIGSGIFRVPGNVAEMIHSVGGISLLWIVAGLVTLCLALSMAELGTMFPHAGGNFVFINEAWGPLAAFVYGWVFLLINPAAWAAISLVFAEYLSHFVPMTDFQQRLVAIGLIALCVTANYRSVPLAAAVMNVAASAKALALLALVVFVFAFASGTGGALAQPITFELPGLSVFGAALVLVLWPYEGVSSFCALCGEVRSPERTLPRALIIGVLSIIGLYLLMNAAYAYALPLSAIAGSKLVARDAVIAVAGPAAAGFVAALVMLCTFGSVAGLALADPRVFYAMSKEGLFFKGIGQVHPRFQTPHVAVVITGVMAALYVSVRTFAELTQQFILGLWPFYALAVLGVMRLRRTRPDLPRPYRTLGYPVVPIIFLCAALYLLGSSLIQTPGITLGCIGVTLLGIPVYYAWRHLAKPQ